jgi:hypothetical protein
MKFGTTDRLLILRANVKRSHYRPGQALRGQEVEALRFQDNRHMKVSRLSALCTGRLYPPGNVPGTRFCYRLSLPQGYSAAGRIMSIKNYNDPSGIKPATFRLVEQYVLM